MQNKSRVRANIAHLRSESPESRFSSDYGKNIDKNLINPWDATRALSRASEENRFFSFANNYRNSNKGQVEENKLEDNNAILDELTAEYNRISHQDSQDYISSVWVCWESLGHGPHCPAPSRPRWPKASDDG
jgi:hypothetical protein